MTATPPVDRAATSRLVAMEQGWTAIRTQHPEVPQAVIVVASGSDPEASSCIGPRRRRPLATYDQPSHRPEVLVPDTSSGSPPDRARRSARPVPAGRSR